MIKLEKINDEVVKPSKLPPVIDKKKIQGYSLFENPWSNIFICAKKKFR